MTPQGVTIFCQLVMTLHLIVSLNNLFSVCVVVFVELELVLVSPPGLRQVYRGQTHRVSRRLDLENSDW